MQNLQQLESRLPNSDISDSPPPKTTKAASLLRMRPQQLWPRRRYIRGRRGRV